MWWVAEGVRYQLRHVLISVILQFQEYFEAAENIAHSDHYICKKGGVSRTLKLGQWVRACCCT